MGSLAGKSGLGGMLGKLGGGGGRRREQAAAWVPEAAQTRWRDGGCGNVGCGW
jgi:hypothetical protein